MVYEILGGDFSTFIILIQLHELGSGVGTYVTLLHEEDDSWIIICGPGGYCRGWLYLVT